MRRFGILLASAALAVLLSASAAMASELDQENDAPITEWQGFSSLSQSLAQTFTVEKGGSLDAIELYALDSGDGGQAKALYVCEVGPLGLEAESCFETSMAIEYPGDMGTPPDWTTSTNTEDVLQSGKQYAILLFQGNERQQIEWAMSGDTYSGGQSYRFENDIGQPGAEVTPLNGDFLFRTYMTPDTTAPTGSVVINDGATRTKTRLVTLKLSATDAPSWDLVSQVRIKNAGGNWAAWQPYAESKDWKLTRGAGKKVVYVQYRDAAGNVSAKASDSITYRP